MTEREIINDVECCIRGECARCSRAESEECKRTLLKNCLQALKLQQQENEITEARCRQLEQENFECKWVAKCDFKIEDLVNKLNNIIRMALDNDYYDERHPFDIVESMNELLDYIDKDKRVMVVVPRDVNAPKYIVQDK